ncbi:MAG: methylenetetrahydrofolate reductase [Thermodesulfobacteriota bacterium]
MQLQQKLTDGEFAILVEMEPPKGADTVAMIANAWAVKGKVDAYIIPEMSNAVMKMSSLGGALLLQSRGLETVLQVCCRDRNRLAIQGDLLAAQALGVPNVMAVTGEEIAHGDHHKARAVYDLELQELLEALKTLRGGRDLAGVDLQGSPDFYVGSTMKVTPRGELWDQELEELDRKIAAGAAFFITQPIFDPEALARLQESLEMRRAAVIPSVLLLKSVGMAKYINRHMEMKIPEEFVNRIQKAPDRVRECVQIAAELVAAFKAQGCPGVNISTIGWEDKLPGILAAAGV